MIASNGAALPEAVDDLSPSLEPSDEDAWFELLRQWIEDPRARVQYEAKILTNFSRPTWEMQMCQVYQGRHSGAAPISALAEIGNMSAKIG